MGKSYRTLRIITLIALAVFTAISALDCFAIVERYMVNQDLFKAGDTVLRETRSNALPIIVVLALGQAALSFVKKRWARVVNIALAILSLLTTVLYKFLCNISEQLMGGLVSTYCKITWLGYVAIFLSILIAFLQTLFGLRNRDDYMGTDSYSFFYTALMDTTG